MKDKKRNNKQCIQADDQESPVHLIDQFGQESFLSVFFSGMPA